MSTDEVNFLDPDPERYQMPGQKYALVSFVSPQSNQKYDKIAMKLRGVFATLEEASARAKAMQKFDKLVDIFVVEQYQWVPVPPCPDDVKSQEYQDGMLNDIISGHAEQQELAAQEFENRKMEMIEKNKKDNEEKTKAHTAVQQQALEQEDPWMKSKREAQAEEAPAEEAPAEESPTEEPPVE